MSIMGCWRHDISDSIREKPEPRLPGREGSRGGGARYNRRLVNAVFVLCAQALRAGSPPPLAAGATSADASSVDAIMACGSGRLKFRLMIRTPHG